MPWKVKVVDFGELYAEAKSNYGERFVTNYEEKLEELKSKIDTGEFSLITENFNLVEFVYDYIDDISPRIVMGLVSPYYPNVSNILRKQVSDKVDGLYDKLLEFTRKQFKQNYTKEYFCTGISDLSYSYIEPDDTIEQQLLDTMPFFGNIYTIPVEEIKKVSIPCINIGPWGKDFHKLTERVLKEDLYKRTLEILNFAIEYLLEH